MGKAALRNLSGTSGDSLYGTFLKNEKGREVNKLNLRKLQNLGDYYSQAWCLDHKIIIIISMYRERQLILRDKLLQIS